MKRILASIGLASALVLLGRPGLLADEPVPIAALLNDYLQSHFDEAVARAASLKDAGDVATALTRDAADWIRAEPGAQERRRLAVAAFALEFTHARMATDWRTLQHLLEWACALLRDGGPPTEGERQWHLATISVAGRARDFGRLSGMQPEWFESPGSRPDLAALWRVARESGHLAHTFERFPDEPGVLLAVAMMVSLPVEGDPRTGGRGLTQEGIETMRRWRMRALEYLEALRADPQFTAVADLHAGYLHYGLGSPSTALPLMRVAARGARDPETAYLAHFLAGRLLVATQRREEAAAEFEAALRIRPRAQSAGLELSALRAAVDQTDASGILRSALDSHDPFDDPWRLYGYGDYVRWPSRRTALREALK